MKTNQKWTSIPILVGVLVYLAAFSTFASLKVNAEDIFASKENWLRALGGNEKLLKNPAYQYVQTDSNLPRVLVYGDSISIGYTPFLREELQGKVTVQRIPRNGGDTQRGFEALAQAGLEKGKWDVIHFNWGLHDLKYVRPGNNGKVTLDVEKGEQVHSVEKYVENLEKLVSMMKASGAKLIFATTTPVPVGSGGRKNGDAKRFNDAALKVMKKHNIAVNDLYGLVLPKLEAYQRPKNVHFVEAGSRAMAKHSAKAILVELSRSGVNDKVSIYREGWIDLNKNGKKDPYEDPALDIEKRIDDLIARMNVNEKTCQLATLYGYKRVLKDPLPTPEWKNKIWKDGLANIDEHLNGVRGAAPEYSFPPSKHAKSINMTQRFFIEETRLGIPVDFTNEGIRGITNTGGTCFPAQIGVGSSWDKELVSLIGHVTAEEGRVLGYSNIYSPILDLARDPRWGRVVECYGEDPFLVKTLGVQMVKAIRAEGLSSSPKHFAVYSVPKGGRDGRARTDPHVAPREVEMMYLAPFRAAVREGDALGVMSSYNDYDAIPISTDPDFLIRRLREEWGFRGYVVSDSDAVKFVDSKHHVAKDYKDAVRLTILGGMNVRTTFTPPDKFILPLRELVQEGAIPMKVIDSRVRDVLRVKYLVGLFDSPYVENPEKADKIVHSDGHKEIALRASRESIILLKNENNILPLKKNLKSILVVGPNAEDTEHSISRYGPYGAKIISVLDGIRAAVPDTEVKFARGCETVDANWPMSEILPEPMDDKEKEGIAEAVAKAESVDAIIAVVGESPNEVGESKSRTSLELTGRQLDLVQALHATGKPVVVVLINGRALSVNWIDKHISGVIEAWCPGEWCGRALADVLFGDYNPAGRLSVTFPKTVGQIPLNFPAKPGSQAGPHSGGENSKGNTRIVDPLYVFGHGLSYTTFEYSNLSVAPEKPKANETVTVKIDVMNTGDRAGDEVVQLYTNDEVSSVVTYEQELKGFERVALKPGQKKTIIFTIPPSELALLDKEMRLVVEPGTFKVMVGASSKDIRAKGAFEVVE